MAEGPHASRRLEAAELFEAGRSQAEVARELGVTRTTAMRWYRTWLANGRSGLARTGTPGRPRKLTRKELSAVLEALPRGTSVDRAARIIEERTGVHFHPGHVWRLLKEWGFDDRFDPGPYATLSDPDGNEMFLFEPDRG